MRDPVRVSGTVRSCFGREAPHDSMDSFTNNSSSSQSQAAEHRAILTVDTPTSVRCPVVRNLVEEQTKRRRRLKDPKEAIRTIHGGLWFAVSIVCLERLRFPGFVGWIGDGMRGDPNRF